MSRLRKKFTQITVTTALSVAAIAHGMAAEEQNAANFRIGMISAEDDTPAVEGLSSIRSAFSQALGMPVEIFAARDYEALINAQIGGRVDYAIYSAAAYAAASLRCDCLRPVVAPVSAQGAIGVRSVLIVRPGAGEAARIAIGPADSLTGRLAPLASWPAAADMAARGGLVAVGSSSEAETMFLQGTVDGFFGWVPAFPGEDGALLGGTLARLGAAGLGPADFTTAWTSPILLYGPHAVHADMPVERMAQLQRLLIRVGADDPQLRVYLKNYLGGGFVAAAQEDYAAVIEAIAAIAADTPSGR